MNSVSFNADNHTYTVNRKKVPSVTEKLNVLDKPGLIQWACDQVASVSEQVYNDGYHVVFDDVRYAWKNVSAEYADAGTHVHEWLEREAHSFVDSGQEGQFLPQIDYQLGGTTDGIDAMQRAIKLANINEILYAEKPMYYRDGDTEFCGTPDNVALVSNTVCGTIIDRSQDADVLVPAVIDYKTSGSIYSQYYLQIGAYGRMADSIKVRDFVRKSIVPNCDLHTMSRPCGGIIISVAQKDKKNSRGELKAKEGDIAISVITVDEMRKNAKAFIQLCIISDYISSLNNSRKVTL